MTQPSPDLWTRFGGSRYRDDYRFDPSFYLERNRDVREAGIDPQDHYDRSGKKENRPRNAYAAAAAKMDARALDQGLSELLTNTELKRAVAERRPGAAEIAYELIQLGSPIDMQVSNFSSRHYLDRYPDIGSAGIEPLYHYIRFGRHEGRETIAQVRENVYAGKQAFDARKPTVLIVSHDFSRTGAPAVALDLAREAAKTHNVVAGAAISGPLLDRFCEESCAVVVSRRPEADWDYFGIDALNDVGFGVLNSVESWPFIRPLVARGVPFASYVHEFYNYVLPSYKAKLMALYSEKVAFSSAMVRQSWQPMLRDIGFHVERDSLVIAQDTFVSASVDQDAHARGRRVLAELIGAPTEGRRVVYGAGAMQIRKGTDLFAMTAQQVRATDNTVLFVWIGDGANPEDIHFGVWLEKHLEEAGANDPGGNLFTIPAGPYYYDVCAAADVLYLPSRLDPLPNVVFDAAKHGTTTVMFRGATGFDDDRYAHELGLVRVGYGDLPGAARAIARAPLKSSWRRKLALRVADRAQREAPRVFEAIRAAVPERPPHPAAGTGMLDAFDVSLLYNSTPSLKDARQRERALLRRNQRLAIWHTPEEAERVLSERGGWVHQRTRIATHMEFAPNDSALRALPPFNVHVHAHYLDGLRQDLELHAYRMAERIVVTTTSDENVRAIERLGVEAEVDLDVRLVTNQGRDVLPFLRLLADDACDNAAIWCHMHQKKSVASAQTGDVWREFLVRCLLGGEGVVSSALTEIARPHVGLVSAFDPHIMGWSASVKLVPEVERRLGRALPAHPLVFPVGQMMWTRAATVRRMFAMFGADYPWPNEPLPNDGTIYHMIERLWPAVTVLEKMDSVFLSNPSIKRIL